MHQPLAEVGGGIISRSQRIIWCTLVPSLIFIWLNSYSIHFRLYHLPFLFLLYLLSNFYIALSLSLALFLFLCFSALSFFLNFHFLSSCFSTFKRILYLSTLHLSLSATTPFFACSVYINFFSFSLSLLNVSLLVSLSPVFCSVFFSPKFHFFFFFFSPSPFHQHLILVLLLCISPTPSRPFFFDSVILFFLKALSVLSLSSFVHISYSLSPYIIHKQPVPLPFFLGTKFTYSPRINQPTKLHVLTISIISGGKKTIGAH